MPRRRDMPRVVRTKVDATPLIGASSSPTRPTLTIPFTTRSFITKLRPELAPHSQPSTPPESEFDTPRDIDMSQFFDPSYGYEPDPLSSVPIQPLHVEDDLDNGNRPDLADQLEHVGQVRPFTVIIAFPS